MFPGSAGSGAEPLYPTHGFAHPYLDPSVVGGGGPAPFTAYASRAAPFSGEGDARAASTESSPTESDAFTKEDRVLLRLLYHQQQAIQVQLNTMTEWAQQVNYRLAALERQARHQPRLATSTSPATASPAAPPPSRSTSTAEAALAGAAPPRPMAGSAPPSVYSSQGLAAPGASSVPAMSSVLENSRACTPPSEQSRPVPGGALGGSAVPSTSRSLESALAPPWDPHSASLQSASGAGQHSRTSSHASALGRRANPLLGSSSTMSKLPTAPTTGAAAAVARSSWGDPRPLSRPDGGTTQTSFSSGFASFDTQQPPSQAPQHRQPPIVSPPTAASGPYGASTAYTAADAFVPPYRRLPPEATARQPLSRTAAAPTTAASAATRAMPPPSAGAVDTAQSRRGREGTLPPASSTGASTGTVPEGVPVMTGGEARESRPLQSATAASSHRDPAAAATVAAADLHSASRESQEGQRRRTTPNDDSLSDGYGSYESRMYMKSIGLL